jgi:hypothetical protein
MSTLNKICGYQFELNQNFACRDDGFQNPPFACHVRNKKVQKGFFYNKLCAVFLPVIVNAIC